MFTRTYLKQLAERAIKAAVAALAAFLTADGFNLLDADWRTLASLVGTAVLTSIAMSILSAPVGPTASPSLVATTPPTSGYRVTMPSEESLRRARPDDGDVPYTP